MKANQIKNNGSNITITIGGTTIKIVPGSLGVDRRPGSPVVTPQMLDSVKRLAARKRFNTNAQTLSGHLEAYGYIVSTVCPHCDDTGIDGEMLLMSGIEEPCEKCSHDCPQCGDAIPVNFEYCGDCERLIKRDDEACCVCPE